MTAIRPLSTSFFTHRVAGWGVAALIGGELFSRFYIAHPKEPTTEFFAYRRLEVIGIGGMSLILTAFFASLKSSFGLKLIATYTFHRLCLNYLTLRDIKRLFQGDLEGSSDRIQHALVSLLELFSRCYFTIIFFDNRGVKKIFMQVMFFPLIYGSVRMIHPKFADNRDTKDFYLTALKTERVLTLLSLLEMSSRQTLAIGTILFTGVPLLILSRYSNSLIRSIMISCFALPAVVIISAPSIGPLLLKKKDHFIQHEVLKLVLGRVTLPPNNSFFTRLGELKHPFKGYAAWLKNCLSRPPLMITLPPDLLTVLGERRTGSSRIQFIFKHLASQKSNPNFLIQIIQKYPNALTPDFLAVHPWLWESFSQGQLEQFIKPSSILKLSNDEEFFQTLSNQIQQLEQQPHASDKEKQAVFTQLRESYGKVESLNLDFIKQVIDLLPEQAVAEDVVTELKKKKNSCDQILKTQRNLQEKIQSLVGDLFSEAIESLPGVGEEDIQDVLQTCGKKIEGSALSTLQQVFKQKDIWWKGDVIAKGLWQLPNNSKEALKQRLIQLLTS